MTRQFFMHPITALIPLFATLSALVLQGHLALSMAGLVLLAAGAGVTGLHILWKLRFRATDEAANALLESVSSPAMQLSAAQKIERAIAAWRQERDNLKNLSDSRQVVIEMLPDPVLMVDGQLRLVRINRAGRDLFGEGHEDRPLSATVRDPVLLEAIHHALNTDTPQSFEWSPSQQGERTFRILMGKVPVEPHVRTRVIVGFSDITAVKQSQRSNVDFVANASHELRTPLTSLIGFIETLQGPARDDPVARAEFLGIMHEQAARMGRLVGDLLSLSRIERKLHDQPTGSVDMADIVQKTVASLTPSADKANMRFALDVPATLAVRGDLDELFQLACNLCDNALKYGAEQTAVQVKLLAEGDKAVFSVLNQGEGIPSEEIPRLTERFYRAANARNKSDSGTGLGLAIVQNIVNRHRGTLEITSERGSHTLFTVTLPLA